jgi:phospholipid N-methyltransferase
MLREFVKSPATIGAVAPSSDALARAMVAGIDWEKARVVVECGPGTGAFTGRIRERLAPGAHFFAVELNPGFAAEFFRRHPGVPLHQGCVSDLPELCRAAGHEVDALLSGLPWAAFSPEDQQRLLGAMHASLRPGGQFATFAYHPASALPAGRRFRQLLERTFSRVEKSGTVWRNLPPAFVYRCHK